MNSFNRLSDVKDGGGGGGKTKNNFLHVLRTIRHQGLDFRVGFRSWLGLGFRVIHINDARSRTFGSLSQLS